MFNEFISLDQWRVIVQLVLAAILGGVLGIEREYRDKPAGLRTYLLVCVGAALFTILSREGFQGSTVDPTRIAANVVVGIGFIGAGAILHRKTKIEGLTTAAGLWIVAAIGMAVGSQYYVVAIAVTIMVLSILLTSRKIYQWIARSKMDIDEKDTL